MSLNEIDYVIKQETQKDYLVPLELRVREANILFRNCFSIWNQYIIRHKEKIQKDILSCFLSDYKRNIVSFIFFP